MTDNTQAAIIGLGIVGAAAVVVSQRGEASGLANTDQRSLREQIVSTLSINRSDTTDEDAGSSGGLLTNEERDPPGTQNIFDERFTEITGAELAAGVESGEISAEDAGTLATINATERVAGLIGMEE